jgi:hypothetical protein
MYKINNLSPIDASTRYESFAIKKLLKRYNDNPNNYVIAQLYRLWTSDWSRFNLRPLK